VKVEGIGDELPISRATLHDQVVSRLRDLITEGRLEPGDRINETQIGTLLGVSRTPLREALKTLMSEGLIEIVPNRGAWVRRFSLEENAAMIEALKIWEAAAARLACERASDAEIAAVRALHLEMMDLYEKRERLAYFKLNQRLHSEIDHLSKNFALVWAHESIQARMKRSRYIGNEEPRKWETSVREHEAIINALVSRDADRLAEMVSVHLDNTLSRLSDSLRAEALLTGTG
jgi:DNA-binding GntR family transcriptional regulator